MNDTKHETAAGDLVNPDPIDQGEEGRTITLGDALPSMDDEVAAGRVVETTQPGDANRTFAPAHEPSSQGDGHAGSDEPAQLLRTDGPTLEEFVAAGYFAVDYPPTGYAPKPSAALTRFTATGELPTADELEAGLQSLNAAAAVAGEPVPAGTLSAEAVNALRRGDPKARRQFAASQGSK